MAVDLARLTAATEIELLVLAAWARGSVAVDLTTGALVRARWPDDGPPLAPLAVARAPLAPDQGAEDPARPEAVELATAPRPVGHLAPRRAERWLRPLLHPPRKHLLGFPGPAAPYWTLGGDRPSVALVAPRTRPVLRQGRCVFAWNNVVHALPLLPCALAWRPDQPRRVLVTLTGPRRGRCYKVVAALLP